MPIKSVDAVTLKKWLDQHEAVLVDVREVDEFNTESIAGSHLIPVGKVAKGELPNHQGKKIVVHCRSGKRSHLACVKLSGEDATLDLYNLEGGILAWIQAGLPIKRA